MINIIPTIGIAMATFADWGELYTLNSDTGLVMPLRSYYIRDFAAGDWTDLAIGLIYVAHGDPTIPSDFVDERQSETDPSNLFHFGLTTDNGTNQITSVSDNPYFLGLRGIIGGVTQITTSPSQLAQLYPTLVNNGAAQTIPNTVQLPLNAYTVSNPFSMVGLRFTRNKLTGQIWVNCQTQNNVTLTSDADDITAITTFLKAMSNTQATSIAQFPLNSVVNFSTFYIYWPYLLNHFALHALGVIQFG